jgi:hypothetical protein
MSHHKEEPYSVGYGKPPKATRFKPGQSGNPRGRPKASPCVADLVRKELKRKRVIVEDGERIALPMIEILVKRLMDLAIKGRLPALKHIFALADQYSGEQDELKSLQIPTDASVHEAAEIYLRMIKGS